MNFLLNPYHSWMLFVLCSIACSAFFIWWICYVLATHGNVINKKTTRIKWFLFSFFIITLGCSTFLLNNSKQVTTKEIQYNNEPIEFVCVAKPALTPPKGIITGGISIAGPSAGATRYNDDYSVYLKDPNGIVHRVDDMQLYFNCVERDTIILNAYIDKDGYQLSDYISETK